MKNDYYVYEWYNIDTEEVFYVGKGRGDRYKNISQRNDYFKNYYNKYNCGVRKIKANLEENEAFNLEVELISKYRAINQAKCNITNGGEGASFIENSWNDLFRKLQYLHDVCGAMDDMINEEEYDSKNLKTKSQDELTKMYKEYLEYKENLKLNKLYGFEKPKLSKYELETQNIELVILTELIANKVANENEEFNEYLNYKTDLDFYTCDFDTDNFIKLILNNNDYMFELIKILMTNLDLLKHIAKNQFENALINVKSYNIDDKYINIKFNTYDCKTIRRVKIDIYDIIWGVLMYKNKKPLYQIIYEEIFVSPFIN